MPQVQFLAQLRMALGQQIDGFECGVIFYPRIFEIDYDFDRIPFWCKQREEILCGGKK